MKRENDKVEKREKRRKKTISRSHVGQKKMKSEKKEEERILEAM